MSSSKAARTLVLHRGADPPVALAERVIVAQYECESQSGVCLHDRMQRDMASREGTAPRLRPDERMVARQGMAWQGKTATLTMVRCHPWKTRSGPEATMAPATACGYVARSQNESIAPYEPPKVITGTSIARCRWKAAISRAKSSSTCAVRSTTGRRVR